MNSGLWKVTKGVEEVRREMAAEREKRERMVGGLVRCSVCGGAAKAVEFGAGGLGVWVGCDRSAECSRYIEIHTEGWSLEETAREWNRYNSGMFRVIRRVKRWLRERFGEQKRAENRLKLQKEAEIEAEKAKRGAIFGVKAEKRGERWWKIWRKGNK